MRTVLSIAGSDSIGGAGIQADLKAIASLDLHGASAITAITAQNTQKVSKIIPVSARNILAQIDAVLEDADVSAVKTGMLFSGDIAGTVSRRLKGEDLPIVVDPVLIAGVGDKLCSGGLVETIKKNLLPMAAVVTPNRQEAEVLSSMTIDDEASAIEACKVISDLGPGAVLIKGGHFDGEAVIDFLYHAGRVTEFSAPRSPNKVHGAGCTLASYIAGNISKGMDLRSAVLDAKRRITDAIALSYPIGEGMFAINPMASKQKEALRGERIESLRSTVEKLEKGLPSTWVPGSGGDFVYSLPNPQGFSEVCGIDGGIKISGRRMKRGGDVRFNVSKDLARISIAVSRYEPRCLSALTLSATDANVELMRRSGLRTGDLDSEKNSRRSADIDSRMRVFIEQTGFVPDIIFDKWGMGLGPMIVVIGTSPAEILRKIGPILR